ncbi:MAG: transcription-repair coupling factor [Clostridia bacterium]|nr:transcription-repair coupling factor [Clostridia bacterium]
MNELFKDLQESQKFIEIISNIEKRNGPITISGLSDVGEAQFISAIRASIKNKICIITYNELQARRIAKDLKYFYEDVCIFPKREIASYDYLVESKDLPFERIEILNKMKQNKPIMIVTTIEAIMQKMVSKDVLYKNILKLKVGNTCKLDDLKIYLTQLGYERSEMVEGRGQFCIRGGIADISIDDKYGVRIEFWGDEIDSIRKFDILSQRSIEMSDSIEIYPCHEFILEQDLDIIKEKIKKYDKCSEEDKELISNGNYLSKIDKYFDFFYENSCSFLDYLDDNFLVILDEQTKIKQRIDNIKIDNDNLIKSITEKGRAVPDSIKNISEYSFDIEKIYYIDLEKTDATFGNNIYYFNYRDVNFYKAETDILLNQLKESLDLKRKVIILGGTEESARKISLLLTDNNINHRYTRDLNKVSYGEIVVTTGALSSGFECKDTKLLVVSSEEFFTTKTKKKRANKVFKQSEKVVFADLKIGDYVVHKIHGIGQYIGVNTIRTGDVTKDYIKIRYKNDDILYVPTNSLDTVRKYVGGDGAPKIYKLGGKDWSNTKAKVKNNLREVARELIELYAKRQKVKGHAFSPDNEWQTQFENSFQYAETDDQLRCIEEVKKDMESDKPMDRLLCGDVGYGKTEVAIRAAFKAVMDQKQVVYLVPTTVLADQQYENFKERMKEYPIRVSVLNRFKTKKEQDTIIKKLKLGEIDIVIGTHRALSKDVEFKDLGLLIIDEEHRFGVKDKEKIKQLKNTVDVLTMTATPIPRTLHMSIVGVRDMSVIYEPPQNRKPVQTYVMEYDTEVIKEAITKELERGGQVYYLYNNVEGIEKKAAEISNLVDEANVGYAHGKMTGKEIEEIMFDFISKKTNVLVCTTILESGIDIPNANTIIVENAERLGLAQLYQIRGRVGRSNRQAYAYVMYRRDKVLSEIADKRLKSIKEFTEFGSGFKIAMRDLEIRGAGSLLGEIQHGHMEQVGYDMYCKLLDEVVKEMQGYEVEEEIDVQIDINISSYIPDEFISDSSQKIEIYQDIAICETESDIQDIIDEIIDRYGVMPEELENLIDIARIKSLAKHANVIKIEQKAENFVFYFNQKKFETDISVLAQKYKNQIMFSQAKDPYITLKVKEIGDKKKLEAIKEFLKNF